MNTHRSSLMARARRLPHRYAQAVATFVFFECDAYERSERGDSKGASEEIRREIETRGDVPTQRAIELGRAIRDEMCDWRMLNDRKFVRAWWWPAYYILIGIHCAPEMCIANVDQQQILDRIEIEISRYEKATEDARQLYLARVAKESEEVLFD